MNFVRILLLAFIILVEGKTERSSQTRHSSASSPFQRELRWLIEKVHPINQKWSGETLQRSRDIQIWKTRKAFAAAERALGKSLGKRSLSRDFLKRVTSLIKEKEDSSIKSRGPAKVVFLLDGSGDIGFKEIKSYKLFVKDVYENLNIPPSGITFGLLECGSRYYTQKYILSRTVQSSNMLDLNLEKLVPANGSCELGQSLQMINMNVFRTLSRDTRKALVVVLAGRSLDDATKAAKDLGKKGVRIIAFGAGGHADMRQLVRIADSPLYAFKVPKLKYLPSMSSTVVGFVDKVIEPKYLNNEVATSELLKSSDGVKQASYRDSNDNTDPNNIGEPPYSNDDLLQGLPPILDQLEGHVPDSWISASESDRMKQAADSYPSQDVPLPNTAPYAGISRVRPTQAQAGGQIGTTQSDWNFAGSKVTPTTQKEKNHFHDVNIMESNAEKTQENIPSSSQKPGKLPPNNNSLVSPVSSAQDGINGSSAAPPSGTNGEINPAPVTSPNQVVGNQGHKVLGANSLAYSSSPSQVGSIPSSGTNGASSPAPVISPGRVGGAPSSGTNGANNPAPVTSQGKEIPGGVSPPAGGAITPNKAGTGGNSGATAGSTGKSVGLPQNPAQPNGLVQVVQTQLLPMIPVLPIQALPIQAIQPATGKNQPSVLAVNQSEISQGNSNVTNNNNEVGSKGENKQNQGETTRTPMPAGDEHGGQNEIGQGVHVLPTTRQSNPNLPGSDNNPSPERNKPSPLITSASESPPKGKNEPSSSHPLTTSLENKNPAPHENMSGNLSETKNKPTSNPAAAGSPATGKTSFEKINRASAKPTQQPPIVLCQVICGPTCCLFTSKPTTKKSTTPTPKTSTPPTREKSTKPTTEPVPEVIAGPPIAFRYPHRPGWFPQGTHSIPQHPIPILPNPLPAPLDSPPETISSSIQLPMYMTIPPARVSPQNSSHEGRIDPFFDGHCHDVHPDCDSFVMNGMCDQSIPFKEIFNVLELCKQSCGVCNSLIKHGQDIGLDSNNKSKEPEDIGFPEYSKKFLKRQVRGSQTTQERQLI